MQFSDQCSFDPVTLIERDKDLDDDYFCWRELLQAESYLKNLQNINHLHNINKHNEN
jgi:hypothetical protein